MQIGLGLMAWSTGASRQLINVLHHACLSVSYPSVSSIITSLADHSIEKAKTATKGPHALAYDNINISSSIFVEQGPNAMSKVQSGTFAVIYELLNARLEDMQIQPMMERLRKASPLKLYDLRPTGTAMHSYREQTAVTICHILIQYVDGFDKKKADPLLQHKPRRPLPQGHKTIFFPCRASTIEEASVDGNLHVHDNIYRTQMQKTHNKLNSLATAIPTMNDQLTCSRIRGAQALRRKDVSAWERRELFQLAFGVFHLAMNLLWALLQTHRGALSQTGSLTHLFAVLEKTRLGNEHPDYHTLLSALTQILHGLMLNAWRTECGQSTLDDFAKAKPSVEELLRLARTIINDYAVPKTKLEPTNAKYPPKDIDDPASTSAPISPGDTVNENVILLTRDLLYVVELVNAVAMGDFGRVEDILPTLACMFRGAGSNNYSTEILHLLFNIKEVWTPQFAYSAFSCSCVHF